MTFHFQASLLFQWHKSYFFFVIRILFKKIYHKILRYPYDIFFPNLNQNLMIINVLCGANVISAEVQKHVHFV